MTRTAINFWLDILLLVLFLVLCWCSAILHFVFPPGPQSHGWSVWGWAYSAWADFQMAVLSALALAVLVHVMLHWTWVCGIVASYVARRRGAARQPVDDGIRTLYGVATLIILLHAVGLGVALAWLMVEEPSLDSAAPLCQTIQSA